MDQPVRRLLLAALAASLSLPALAQQGAPAGTNPFGNFTPNFGGTQTISATTTSSSVTLTNGVDTSNTALLFNNAGTGTAFCRWGSGAQTALTTDVPILASTVQVFFKPPVPIGQGTNQAVACITASGTATVYVTTGFGR
jgi:hypothetical protein